MRQGIEIRNTSKAGPRHMNTLTSMNDRTAKSHHVGGLQLPAARRRVAFAAPDGGT